jgi:hypothetical protein
MKWTLWLVTLMVALPLQAAGKDKFRCESTLPAKLQINAPESCNQNAHWVDLSKLYESDRELFKETLRKQIADNNNQGGSVVRFGRGKTKRVLRSSILGNSEGCIDELVTDPEYNIRTIINLFTGDALDQQSISDDEQKLFQKWGARNYLHVLNFSDRPDAYPTKQAFDERIVEIISQIKNAKGNVLIHCLGGWHRTGIIWGILQKCYNKVPTKTVIDNYKCHVAWKSESDRGGYYDFNEKTIAEFPCDKLDH